ncbi:cytochrome bd oxidase small subunit, CydX/CbdX family [Kushneria phosphatilytica]|uniref:Cytochrome bd oxidase small subunit, CydX/CbdX family n=1 Tax=Kushneria phosphatilytica TaxID=657387 RepID=A0A5C0ZU39_9GAMM|nr:cytochrome bd oxidase small subunit, CydX/CbdX family [Kushneria phosphatilytica]QEL10070.1 cytochrome bd oxidase small subunit, CydX/CbdX family [Kushneria phosphatilytica]
MWYLIWALGLAVACGVTILVVAKLEKRDFR